MILNNIETDKWRKHLKRVDIDPLSISTERGKLGLKLKLEPSITSVGFKIILKF